MSIPSLLLAGLPTLIRCSRSAGGSRPGRGTCASARWPAATHGLGDLRVREPVPYPHGHDRTLCRGQAADGLGHQGGRLRGDGRLAGAGSAPPGSPRHSRPAAPAREFRASHFGPALVQGDAKQPRPKRARVTVAAAPHPDRQKTSWNRSSARCRWPTVRSMKVNSPLA